MIREIFPSGPVRGIVRVPGSKSMTNRALICAALASGESIIRNASDSDDTTLLANGLNQMGVLVRKNKDELHVTGTGGVLYAPKFPIPVGNAGTTFRFLLSLAALAQGKTTFECDPRLAERPIGELTHGLHQLDVATTTLGTRFSVEGRRLAGGDVRIDARRSSQFLSSLMLIAPYAATPLRLVVDGVPASQSYIGLTRAVMSAFGVTIELSPSGIYALSSTGKYHAGDCAVEPDASGASYFFAAAALTGGDVLVRGLSRSSIQGDAGFAGILEQMGCDVREEAEGVRVVGTQHLRGVDVDMNSMPDVVPTLAVTALFAQTPTRIRNVAHLRHKESDRMSALVLELNRLGGKMTTDGAKLQIEPSELHGAQLDTYEDHRLVMSFALAGLRVPGVKVENPQCVRKSFPKFWDEWESLIPKT
jgi:3-phosphoshikimate 1-carboxyvinyltransferase